MKLYTEIQKILPYSNKNINDMYSSCRYIQDRQHCLWRRKEKHRVGMSICICFIVILCVCTHACVCVRYWGLNPTPLHMSYIPQSFSSFKIILGKGLAKLPSCSRCTRICNPSRVGRLQARASVPSWHFYSQTEHPGVYYILYDF